MAAVNLTASSLAFLVNAGFGAIVFLVLLITMNGYSESDAMWGILTFTTLALVVTFLMTAAAMAVAHRLRKRKLGGAVVVLISAGICSAVGTLLISASGVAGIVVVEIVRTNF